jgi:hypothetical protein
MVSAKSTGKLSEGEVLMRVMPGCKEELVPVMTKLRV